MPIAARAGRLLVATVLAAGLGLGGALVTVGFVELLRAVHEWLWVDLPSALDLGPEAVVFVVPMCAVGGVLVGASRHRLGEYPPSLEESLARFGAERGFDDRHLPQAVTTSLVGLGFGAALGPEAVLVALVGGIGTWIGRRISAGAEYGDWLAYLGSTSVLGALIGVARRRRPAARRRRRPRPRVGCGSSSPERRRLRPGPGCSSGSRRAAGTSPMTTRPTSSSSSMSPGRCPWPLPARPSRAFFLVVARLTADAGARLDGRPVVQSLAGGLVLGALASISALVLFSGHEGVQTLIDDPTATVGFLLGIAALKLVATATLLGTKWKGGRFFPVMFAAAAVGLAAASAVDGLAETPAMAVVMTGAVAALHRPTRRRRSRDGVHLPVGRGPGGDRRRPAGRGDRQTVAGPLRRSRRRARPRGTRLGLLGCRLGLNPAVAQGATTWTSSSMATLSPIATLSAPSGMSKLTSKSEREMRPVAEKPARVLSSIG